MDDLLHFFSFSDPTVRVVTFGTVFLGLSSSVVGVFAFLQKRSLLGDAISHSILPGVALAFLFTQSKNPLILIAGALVSGWLSILAVEGITSKTKLSSDTAIALVLSSFYGLGIVFLTYIQHTGSGNQAGLDQFLLGRAASLTQRDLIIYVSLAAILLVAVLLFYKEWKLIAFNEDFAKVSGLPVKGLKFALNTITVLAIAVGIQSVGVVLMAALLITPAAAARAWTDKLSKLILIAAAVGALAGLTGSYVSYTEPNMPTGPWIVMCLSVLALGSLFLAPKNGALGKILRQRQNRKKIISENLLKVFYHLEERNTEGQIFNKVNINGLRYFKEDELKKALDILRKNYWIIPKSGGYQLSAKGRDEAMRVVRFHRLWELYLIKRMGMKADHIHPNAETMEHIITPEIEGELLAELDYPEKDPHHSPIPYKK